MDRRYQVFVSSTYEDLKIEREGVVRALLDLECFPSSMEIFGAASSTPWDIIKSTIELCDYYLVISAGRYGSTTESGISYTEQEYDYARSLGIPCLAFVHSDFRALPSHFVETDKKIVSKLILFQKKLAGAHLLQMWSSADELKYQVLSSLTKETKRNPRTGWVRAGAVADTEILQKLEEVRSENASLRSRLSSYSTRDPESVLQVMRGTSSSVIIEPSMINKRDEADVMEYLGDNSIRLNALESLLQAGAKLYSGIDEVQLFYALDGAFDIIIANQGWAPPSITVRHALRRQVTRGILLILDRFQILKSEQLAIGDQSGVETHWMLNDFGRNVYAYALNV